MRRRGFVLAGLVITILLAGGLSQWASNSPDGLNRVAMDHGFNAHERAAVTSDSPIAGYSTSAIDTPWLSAAVAGVAGVATCFAFAAVAAFATRRNGGRKAHVGQRKADPPRICDQDAPT